MDDYNIFEDCDNAKNEATGNGETDFVAELLKIEAAVDDIIESTHACLENLYNMVADFGNKSVALQVEKEELQKRLEAALKERDKAYEYAAKVEKENRAGAKTIEDRTQALKEEREENKKLRAENFGLKHELEYVKKSKKKTAFEQIIRFLKEN